MNKIGKEIVSFFKEKGFNSHLNENQTEETEHFYINRHKPYHIDIQGTCNDTYPYVGMRLIGRRHVEDEFEFDTTGKPIEEIIKLIERQIEEWDNY